MIGIKCGLRRRIPSGRRISCRSWSLRQRS